LSRAAEKGHERIVELLLQNGACPDFDDKNSQTPLTRAIETEHVAVVQLLLAQGAKTDYKYTSVSECNHIWMDLSQIDG
jgi:ankyrin repeat protein